MKTRVLVFLLLTVLMLCSCNTAEKPPEPATEVSDGFNKQGTLFQAGVSVADIEGYNLKNIAFSHETVDGTAEIILRLSFVSGSRLSGSEEETTGSGVPAHAVYALDNPARLVVELDGMAYWDYRRTLSLPESIRGLFQHIPSESPRVSLYFQMDNPVRFLASAEGDDIVVRLRASVNEDMTRYYVTANAYNAYRSGVIPSESDLTPTLSRDLSNILLISPPFSTAEEAQATLSAAQAAHSEIDPALFQIVSLRDGELPVYDQALDYLEAERKSIVRFENGTVATAPVLTPEGLYLADLPDESGFLYSRIETSESGTNYQRLYMSLNNGTVRPATNFEFVSIEHARFSPDGRRLAVLERTSSDTHLYVFDSQTFELLNDLSEMGFGGNTGAFLFNSLGNAIYAITGVSDMQLHLFDYSIPDEQTRHSLIDRNSVDEGSLGYRDGELYFAHSTMEEGATIYRIKPEGGVRKPFMPGGVFAISSDEKYMAVMNAQEASTASGGSDAFEIFDFATGTRKSISTTIYPYNFIWSRDCKRLFYIESRLSGGQSEADTISGDGGETDTAATGGESTENTQTQTDAANTEPYPYTLWVYELETGESRRLFDMVAPDIYPSDDNDTLYLCVTETEGEETLIRATYVLDIGEILNTEGIN